MWIWGTVSGPNPDQPFINQSLRVHSCLFVVLGASSWISIFPACWSDPQPRWFLPFVPLRGYLFCLFVDPLRGYLFSLACRSEARPRQDSRSGKIALQTFEFVGRVRVLEGTVGWKSSLLERERGRRDFPTLHLLATHGSAPAFQGGLETHQEHVGLLQQVIALLRRGPFRIIS